MKKEILRKEILRRASLPVTFVVPQRPRRERKLLFCPESNDLLYPREDKEKKTLVYFCKNCGYEEDVDASGNCVYINELTHTPREKTIIVGDIFSDPTLSRTQNVRCPRCNHNEAIMVQSYFGDEVVMFLTCTSCGDKWQDRA